MPTHRFIVIGLPRSGTTYLSTLLREHPDADCAGELFNPQAIIYNHFRNEAWEDIVARDADPVAAMYRYFETYETLGLSALGFKFMIGHHPRVLQAIKQDQDLRLIYVWRENRLAQVASWLKAIQTKKWAQNAPEHGADTLISVGSLRLHQHCNEFAAQDILFQAWFEHLKNAKMTLEYRDLFTPSFKERLCDFLGLDARKPMESPLVKQGANTVLDRFENPRGVKTYFTQIGHSDWLGPESPYL